MDYRDFNTPSGSAIMGIGAAIDLAVSKNRMGEHLRPHQAIALWSETAGDRVAAVAQAESVRNGVLFVRVKSSVWASELTFYKPDLLHKLNDKLGGEILSDIRFHVGARASRKASGRGAEEPKSIDLGERPPPNSFIHDADPQAKLIRLAERTRSVIAWKKDHGWVACERCSALFEPPTGAAVQKPRSSRKRRRAEDASRICPICRTLAER
jgi:hypothetical protein